jgi:L-asparaginase/Glu-tRNA(Gln) amidotransferase subunit D
LVAAYLEKYVGRSFRELVVEEVCAHDSVDMTPGHWKQVAARIVELGYTEGNQAFVDSLFSSKVGVVLLDPWKTETQYRTEFAGLDGIVVAGYGGGHMSLDVSSGHAVCGVVTDAIRDGKPVVLASQAPLGETDFFYASSLEPLRRGAIAAAGLTLPHARTKLAYLLGHKDAMRAGAQSAGVDERSYLDACFTAGARFRCGTSRRRYAELKGYRPLGTDPFCDLPFDEATVRVRRACFGNLR